MSQRSSQRFTLADLVFVAVLSGLVMALALSPSNSVNPAIVFTLISLAFMFWSFLRHARGKAICEECGRLFVPTEYTEPLIDCPDCDSRQSVFAWSYRRKTIALLATFPLIAIFLAAIFVSLDFTPPFESTPLGRFLAPTFLILGGVLSCSTLVLLVVIRARTPEAKDRTRDIRGGVMKPSPSRVICFDCRLRTLSPAEASKALARVRRRLIWSMFVFIIAVPAVAWGVLDMARSGGWFGEAVLVVGAIGFVSIMWKHARLVIAARRLGGLMSEEGAITKARRFAGAEGMIVRKGSTVVWYSGSEDPTAILLEEFAKAGRRFESLLGHTAESGPPRLALAFHDPNAHRRLIASLSAVVVEDTAHQGFYMRKPWNILTLCTSAIPDNAGHPRSFIGTVHNCLLEQRYGMLPALWVQAGLSLFLGARDHPGGVVRLNRRMIVALSSGMSWPKDLFSLSGLKWGRLFRRSKETRSSQKVDLFLEQSCSIVEYLVGEHAPESRRDAFRAFLKDKTSKVGSEDLFFRHFGFGYGTLLESWREWVIAQGIGPDLPPPPRVRDAILNRVLPVIRDPTAPRKTRIEALREWRREGYVLGADSLIDLLRDPGAIPKDEIVWALRMVSGRLLGDDPEAWQAWWDETPRDRDPLPGPAQFST